MKSEKTPVGMSVRRSGAKLRALGRSHSALHIILWQAREAQRTMLAAGAAQQLLFQDISSYCSKENRALSDVFSSIFELSSLFSNVQSTLALAYKVLRKEMSLILEGELRCDIAHKKLDESEQKRLKLRRQLLRAQNKRQTLGENPRRNGDFTQLETSLAESERAAERAHLEATEITREQEAVKLVILKNSISKLASTHSAFAVNTKLIFDSQKMLAQEIPDPPPPGDPLSCIRYTGYDRTKEIVDQTKASVVQNSPATVHSRTEISISPVHSSTQITSPSSSNSTSAATGRHSHLILSPPPTAPARSDISLSPPSYPPPPYNNTLFSGGNQNSPERGFDNVRQDVGNSSRSADGSRRCYTINHVGSNSISPWPTTPPNSNGSAGCFQNNLQENYHQTEGLHRNHSCGNNQTFSNTNPQGLQEFQNCSNLVNQRY